jgi:excisionase family DNA binding protein
MRKQSLSTGDLARYCQVTPATVVNWIRAGKLDVYNTPGGQYRMERGKFIEFLKANEFPIPDDLQEERERRVLIIDDDEEILALLTETVQSLGKRFVVFSAKNGFDGLIEAGKVKPDVISLDLMMPKMDGAEMCRRLRLNPETKGTRVIVVTGLSQNTELVRRVKRIGIEAVFQKPVNLTEFGNLIKELALGD